MGATVSSTFVDYAVVFQKDSDGLYHVSVPALPGCFTFAESFDEAQVKAKEVIELWLEELAADKGHSPVQKSSWIGHVAVRVPRFRRA